MLLLLIKAGFRLARDGGDFVCEVRSHSFSPRPAFFAGGGVRAARLLRRRMRGRLFSVCGFGLDALSFYLFHLAFFRRGAAAGLLRFFSSFLLFSLVRVIFSFPLFPCLAGRLICSRAGKRREGSEDPEDSKDSEDPEDPEDPSQNGSPSFRLLSPPTHTNAYIPP